MNKTRLQELCQKRRWDLPQYTHRRVELGREHRFVASVTVNGLVFESPDAESSSVKEAQNKAATVAFEALSASPAAPAAVAVSYPPPPPVVESLSPRPSPTEINATFKSQLLIYAQKRSKEPPKYTSVCVGSPHAPLFKATVVIDGLTFECPQVFKTVREAEHAAAEVALANLPKEESSQHNLQDESAVPYKTLLQQYTQKSKQILPVYTTVKDPASSLLLFLSTVEVCGRTFKGGVAKTKKQAEANAAKVALDHMEEWKQSQVSSSDSTSLPVNGMHSSCSNMESELTVLPVSLSPPITTLTEDQLLPGNQTSAVQESRPLPVDPIIEPIKAAAQESRPLPVDPIIEPIQAAAQESRPLPVDPRIEPIQATKDCNLDPAAQSSLGSTANSVYFEGPVLAATKDNGNEGVEPSLLCNKIQVYPYNPGSAVPPGMIALPYSDNTWVAVSLDFLGHGGSKY